MNSGRLSIKWPNLSRTLYRKLFLTFFKYSSIEAHKCHSLAPSSQEQVFHVDDVPVLDQSQPDFPERFRSLWTRSIPVVVPNALTNITLTDVGKEYFIRRYGGHRVTLVDCRNKAKDKRLTLGEYLSEFGHPRSSGGAIWKLKVFIRLIHRVSSSPELCFSP